jgi:hypothetical protein
MLFRLGSMSIELNPWNPLYAVAPIGIVLLSVPLAMFAVITTSIALSLLAFRGLVVYTQLGTALLGAWLSPTPPKPAALRQQTITTPSPERTSPPRSRNRRSSSNLSGTSSQDFTVAAARLTHRSGSFTALLGGNELTRDYEGVGGWRDPGNKEEEALWMGINSRLQLPAATPGRRHQRRHTGGQIPNQRWSWSPEAFRMSPVQNRARTSVRVDSNGLYENADYFPLQPTHNVRPISTVSEPLKRHKRRPSGSASSISSAASSMMASVKEAGE